jgi:hypothetical protein
VCLTVPDDGEGEAERPEAPLHRALDLFVFAPVGVALAVAEDLPELIAKGRERFESDVHNARAIGEFVVTHGQRFVMERLGKLVHGAADDEDANDGVGGADGASDAASRTDSDGGNDAASRTDSGGDHAGAGRVSDAAMTPASAEAAAHAAPTPHAATRPRTPPRDVTPRPPVDPADAAAVEQVLAGYDTLSASQVVRRLESLEPDDLRAVQRYEASHRNRRTILNRSRQLIEAPVGPGATSQNGARDPGETAAAAPETRAEETASSEALGSETHAPDPSSNATGESPAGEPPDGPLE